MGWFGKDPTPPNTISDKDMADLSRRAQKANPKLTEMFHPDAIRHRQASNAQQRKAKSS